MSRKFLHTADLHLDSPLQDLLFFPEQATQFRNATRSAFDRVVLLAMEEGVDFVLFAGDIYDTGLQSYDTALFFHRQMVRLKDAGIKAYVIYGNHDAVSKLDNLEKHKETALLEASRTVREWDALSGSQAAAEAVQRSAVALEQVRECTIEYARLKLCAGALRRGMESYRQQHQVPVLKRAGEAFSRMTLSEFSRLEQDYGKGEQRVLKAVRSRENRSLGHEALSEGTADQLFLALRLAIIDEHRGPEGGMPLILDEILEGADEQRAAAMLKELAEFSKRNQVLLFTHHKHVADLAVSSGAAPIRMPLSEPAAVLTAG